MDKSGGKKRGSGIVLSSLGGGVVACACSVAVTAAYAFVLLKGLIGVESVGAANIAIKLVCSVLAALIASRGGAANAVLRGALAAGFYMVITFTVYSLIAGEFAPGKGTLTDIAMCMLCGAVTAMVVNLARR